MTIVCWRFVWMSLICRSWAWIFRTMSPAWIQGKRYIHTKIYVNEIQSLKFFATCTLMSHWHKSPLSWPVRITSSSGPQTAAVILFEVIGTDMNGSLFPKVIKTKNYKKGLKMQKSKTCVFVNRLGCRRPSADRGGPWLYRSKSWLGCRCKNNRKSCRLSAFQYAPLLCLKET